MSKNETTRQDGCGNEQDDGQILDSRRKTAEIVDVDGEMVLLPPEPKVIGDVGGELIRAVVAALDDEPNALDVPLVREIENGERMLAHVTGRFNETPVNGDDGEVLGWRAPYQAREDFTDALREHLPDGVSFEAKNDHTLILYQEVGA